MNRNCSAGGISPAGSAHRDPRMMWKARVARLRQDTYALYLAALDPRVPWVAKLIIAAVVAYALSPVDLIPDFIPVLGYLDDLLVLPLGILLAIRLIPGKVWADCQNRAREATHANLPRNRAAAVVIVLIWIAVLALAAWWIVTLLGPA